MTRKLEVRPPQGNFDLDFDANVKEVFVDGISQLAVGFPLAKLTMHSVDPAGMMQAGREQRQEVLRLVIPTAVLVDMCKTILGNVAGNKEGILKAQNAHVEALTQALNGLSIE